MTYRLLALDLDGTTIAPDGTVRPPTIAAIRRALEHDLMVVFATGRNYAESKPILDMIGHYPTGIFVGGAVVVETATGEVSHRTGMDAALAVEVVAAVRELGLSAQCLQEGAGQPSYRVVGDPPEAFRWWCEHKDIAWEPFDGDTLEAHEHTIRVGLLAPYDTAHTMETLLRDRLGERVYMHNIEVPQQFNVVEIFDPSVNKWEGIRTVAARHDIRAEKIIAVGDDRNDIHMIEGAGLGVAMGNAKDEIKAIADRVIGTNGEDGLAAFIHEIVEQHLLTR
ncbi:MAG: HAD family hydrolase [Planctomycetota bacterium]